MERCVIEAAAGRKKAKLVFKNAQVVNVFTKQVEQADVAVEAGVIAGVGQYSGEEEVDCTGLYLCPGFVDAHIHVESTMAVPYEFARAVAMSGTTTVVADPHEIVNVCGAPAVEWLLKASEALPVDIYWMMPSSVPATPFETNGAPFTAQEMAPFAQMGPRVAGLGEVMCYPDVVAGTGEIYGKLALFAHKHIDGHAPGLSGKALAAYAAAGIETEHECTSFAEAKEKLAAGLAILVREGSAAKNLTAIVEGLLKEGLPTDRFLFCTDDKHLDDIAREGHIRWNVHQAVQLGMPVVDAICMASYNAARVYGLKGVGAIAPGYRADIVLLDDWKQVHVHAVYKDGVPVEQKIAAARRVPAPAALTHTMHFAPVTPQQLALPVQGKAHVIEMVPYQIVTRHAVEPVPSENGLFRPNKTYSKLCVIERHGRGGNIAVCPLKGYGITGGAIATSVAHDSHNIIAAGDNDGDIALAVNHLQKTGGGYALAAGGRILGALALPVGGLMSEAPWEQTRDETNAILKQAAKMGIPYHVDPFISLSFMALPVIPSLRLTDCGLFDVDTFAFVKE
ncbi:MAG TPA: adenine deaminase [Candidatus Ruthenibacterium merdipullorum]|nr:adenine deaminase [Candidatus Ruthenibacterium merdipullorum]